MGAAWVSIDAMFAAVEARDLAELSRIRRTPTLSPSAATGPSERHVRAGQASGQVRARCDNCRRADPKRRRICTHKQQRRSGREAKSGRVEVR